MNRRICVASVAARLLIFATGLLIAAHVTTSHIDGLMVHEWGTFTSVAGDDGSAVDWDVLAAKDDLPSFVNDGGYRRLKWRLEAPVRMETPVLYFYSLRELKARVSVSLPKGLITEWYPKAEYEVDQKIGNGLSVYRLPPNLNGIDPSLNRLIGRIDWTNMRIEPGASPDLPHENRPNRYYAARATDASPLTVDGQHEKFLFYRGVGRFSVPLSARLFDGGKVVLDICGDEVPMAILFENRGGRLGYHIAGAVSRQIALDRPLLGAEFAPLAEALENKLVEQGLFRKEAQAMIATWRDSWFEEGSRVIYIVPSKMLNTVLPLQIDPVPSQIARVFVGRIELITDEIKRDVEAAIAVNDGCVLDRYGRFLNPILKRIAEDNPASESEIERFRANVSKSNAAGCS